MDVKLSVEAGVHEFAAQLCKAMGMFAYVVVGTVDESLNLVSYGGWAGTVPEDTVSRAPHVAYGKMGELILKSGGLNGQLVMTPTKGNGLSYGWMGAVAQNGLIVSVSKWAQEHDRLLALLALYNQVHLPLRLHHVGIRFPGAQAYEIESTLLESGMVLDVPGNHERTYFLMKEGYYRELQWLPDGPYDDARHWDFVTEDPAGFLSFVAAAYGTSRVFFDNIGEHDPVGVVWVTGSDNTMLGVMARKTWWNIEEG
jgi:hypothetical protein